MQHFSIPTETYKRAATLARAEETTHENHMPEEVEAVLDYALRRGLTALEAIPTGEDYKFNLKATAHDGDEITDIQITVQEFNALKSHLAKLRSIQQKRAA